MRKKSEEYIDNAGALALLLLPRCNRKCSAKETDPWLSNLLLYYSSAYVYSCLLDYFAMQEEEEERAPSRKNEESPGECTTTRDCWRRCCSLCGTIFRFTPGIMAYRWRRAANLKHLSSVLFHHLCHPPPPTPADLLYIYKCIDIR